MKNSFNSYSLDQLTQATARAAYEDTDLFQRNLPARDRQLHAAHAYVLDTLGFDVVPSAANFVFVHHLAHDARVIAAKLKKRKIFVRHFRLPRIDHRLRITVGTDAECDALVAALRELLG